MCVVNTRATCVVDKRLALRRERVSRQEPLSPSSHLAAVLRLRDGTGVHPVADASLGTRGAGRQHGQLCAGMAGGREWDVLLQVVGAVADEVVVVDLQRRGREGVGC